MPLNRDILDCAADHKSKHLCMHTRDVHETFQAETETRPKTQRSETETLGILSETRPRRWGFETRLRLRRSSSRDLGRDVWWKKFKHHEINWTSKHFVFVMLWVFAARALCALRGIAAVRPSVCNPSVTLRYHGHISWATSKIITLRSSLLGAPTSAS